MTEITIATVALQGTHDIELSLKAHLAYIDEAAEAGAHLIAFPEISLQGYPRIDHMSDTTQVLERVYSTAESVPDGRHVSQIVSKAIERQIHVIFGVSEAGCEPSVVYNTAVLTGPHGFIGSYRKVHVVINEQLIWRRGNDWPVFETQLGKIGMLICYDKVWPESCRELVLRGADLLVMPTAWGWGDEDHDLEDNHRCHQYLLYDQVRAAENQRWFVSSNYCGESDGHEYLGLSQIVDPLGRIIASSGTSASGLTFATVDIRAGIATASANLVGAHIIRDRRPETYRALRNEIPPEIDG